MKKILSILLVSAMMLSLVPMFGANYADFLPKAEAATEAEALVEGYFTYTVDENGDATIVRCNTTASGDIEVPAKLGGYPVVAVGNEAFSYCQKLTKVEISNGVKTIGEAAFENCGKLENVIIGDGVKSIGYQAFYGCVALKEIIIPGNVTQIGDEAFIYCTALKKVVINEGVNVIGKGAFTACSSLTDISISDSVTEIKSSVFVDCTSLVTIVLPKNIKYIDAFLFYNCSSLENVTIPDSVEKIMGKTFWGCSNLVKITIPERVTYIGEHAFAYCQSLESVHIPGGVETIVKDAFLTGGNLKEITVDTKNAYYSSDEYGALFNKDKTCLIQYPGGKTEEVYKVPHGVKKIIDDAFVSSLNVENYDYVFSNVKKLYFPKSLELIEDNYTINADTVYKYVTDIYYEGTQEEYEQIENITTYFPNATVHPNSYDKIVDDEPSEDDVPEMPTVENPVVLDWEEGCFGETEVTEVYECIENNFEKGGVYISENDELYNQFALYRIKILGENGEIVQPRDGYEVTVRILLPQEYKDIKNFYVVHWFNEGGREKIYDVKNDNGCLVFKTKSFSEFAICADLDFGFEDDSAKLNYKSEKNFSATTDSKTKVIYSSSDESVAAVDSNGNVKAVGIGSATITATIDGTEISDSINITVSYAWWQWIIRILLLGFLWY